MAARPPPAGEEELNAVCSEPKLFVGGLRYEVTQDDLRDHFSKYGAIRSASLLVHHATGKSKGCAMVLFDRWTDAEAAVAAENGLPTDLSAPRAAVVKFADPQRNEHGALCGVTPKKLFIGQVPAEVTQDHIRSIFQPYGAIVDLNIMAPRKPGSMGCAFVTYSTWAEAEAALCGVDGNATLPGAGHPIAVKFADAKPAELAKFEARGAQRNAWELGAAPGAPAGGSPAGGSPIGPAPGTPLAPAPSGGAVPGAGGGASSGGKRQGMGGMGPGGGQMPPMMFNPMMMMAPMMMNPWMAQGMLPGMPHMRQQPSTSGRGSGGGPVAGGAGAGGPAQGQPGAGGSYDPSGTSGAGAGGMVPMGGGGMVPMGSLPMGSLPMGSMGSMGSMAMGVPQGYSMGMGMPMPGGSVAMMGAGGMMGPHGPVMLMPGWGPPPLPHGAAGAAGPVPGGGALAAAKAWKLFVGQISFDLTEEQLFPFFAQYGTILELALPRTDGRSRGYAFLTYSNQAEAQAAIEGADGAVVPADPRARALTVRWADSKAR